MRPRLQYEGLSTPQPANEHAEFEQNVISRDDPVPAATAQLIIWGENKSPAMILEYRRLKCLKSSLPEAKDSTLVPHYRGEFSRKKFLTLFAILIPSDDEPIKTRGLPSCS